MNISHLMLSIYASQRGAWSVIKHSSCQAVKGKSRAEQAEYAFHIACSLFAEGKFQDAVIIAEIGKQMGAMDDSLTEEYKQLLDMIRETLEDIYDEECFDDLYCVYPEDIAMICGQYGILSSVNEDMVDTQPQKISV